MENNPVYIYGCRTCNQIRGIEHGYCNECLEGRHNFVPDDLDRSRGADPFPPLRLTLAMLTHKYSTMTLRRAAIAVGELVQDGDTETWYLNLDAAPHEYDDTHLPDGGLLNLENGEAHPPPPPSNGAGADEDMIGIDDNPL